MLTVSNVYTSVEVESKSNSSLHYDFQFQIKPTRIETVSVDTMDSSHYRDTHNVTSICHRGNIVWQTRQQRLKQNVTSTCRRGNIVLQTRTQRMKHDMDQKRYRKDKAKDYDTIQTVSLRERRRKGANQHMGRYHHTQFREGC